MQTLGAFTLAVFCIGHVSQNDFAVLLISILSAHLSSAY